MRSKAIYTDIDEKIILQLPPSILYSGDGEISHYGYSVLTATAGACQNIQTAATILCPALLTFQSKDVGREVATDIVKFGLMVTSKRWSPPHIDTVQNKAS